MVSTYAILAGLCGLAYSYYFVIAKNVQMYSLFLLLASILVLFLVPYLYDKLKDVDNNYAKLGALLLAVGSVGAMVHGGYDLANAINPVAGLDPNLPSQIDPRGLLAFGVTGLGIFKLSLLMRESKGIPEGLSLLGLLSGVLLVVIYMARLTVLSPTNPILLYPVLLEGFIVNPIWYIWLGIALKKK